MFALLGTNGAGKTTTIKMLLTLILPSSGEIKIEGLDIFSIQFDFTRKSELKYCVKDFVIVK